MRPVELNIGDEFVKTLAEAQVSLIDKRLSDAIGYLSMWGFGSPRYASVRIVGDRRGELTAVYMDKDGNGTFTIGAVPDDNWNYSFHS